jgi:hypothetical protein
MKSETDQFTTAELADDASSSPKNRSRRCLKGLPQLRQPLRGRRKRADDPRVARKASQPWALLGNRFAVKTTDEQSVTLEVWPKVGRNLPEPDSSGHFRTRQEKKPHRPLPNAATSGQMRPRRASWTVERGGCWATKFPGKRTNPDISGHASERLQRNLSRFATTRRRRKPCQNGTRRATESHPGRSAC